MYIYKKTEPHPLIGRSGACPRIWRSLSRMATTDYRTKRPFCERFGLFAGCLQVFYRHLLIWAGGALGAVLPTKARKISQTPPNQHIKTHRTEPCSTEVLALRFFGRYNIALYFCFRKRQMMIASRLRPAALLADAIISLR